MSNAEKRIMSDDNQKASAFILRLLGNPALQGLTALQKEEQIIQFLAKNSRQLYPTLSSDQFFQGKNWEQIWKILTAALFEEIDKSLHPTLKNLITDKIELSFIPFLRQQSTGYEKIKEDLYSFIIKLLQKQEARRAFTGPFSALVFNFADRYIDQSFARKEYVHFELTKVQKLKMSKEEMKNMIAVSILLNPAVHLLSVGSVPGQQESPGGTIQTQFAIKVLDVLKNNLPSIPDEVLGSGVNSNVSFLENRTIGATARITTLFVSRCRNYNPNIKIDRGADTADKSWFSIARRNYKFYGYDVKMLDEFYKTAAENGW